MLTLRTEVIKKIKVAYHTYIFRTSIDYGPFVRFADGNIPGHWSCHISDCDVVSKDSPHLDASGKEALPRTPAL